MIITCTSIAQLLNCVDILFMHINFAKTNFAVSGPDLHLRRYITQGDGLHHRDAIDTMAWVRDLIITYMREEAHTFRVPITFKHEGTSLPAKTPRKSVLLIIEICVQLIS